MEVVEIGTCAQEGIGKPDFSKEISSGRTRPGLALKAGQTMKLLALTLSTEASLFAHVKPPLGPGDTRHMVDWETGLDMPFTCPAGYTFAIVSRNDSMSQDFVVKVYFLTQLIGYLATKQGGMIDYEAEVVGIDTALYDPLGLLSNPMDCQLLNNGSADMEGSAKAFGILTAVGTEPLPVIKTVKCKHCGHEETVPRETTQLICPACRGLTLYGDLSKFRGT